MTTPGDPLALAHWRRTVAEMYASVRKAPPAGQASAWEAFRAARNDLFKSHPSCAYNEQWVCPLAPVETWLPFSVEAGEKAFEV